MVLKICWEQRGGNDELCLRNTRQLKCLAQGPEVGHRQALKDLGPEVFLLLKAFLWLLLFFGLGSLPVD